VQCPTALHTLRLFRLPASLTTSNQLGSNPDQADVNDAQVPVFAWFGSDRPSGRRSHVRDVATDVPITRPSGLLHLDLCPLGQGSPLLILALFRTDFEPEVDRSRHGLRPISVRSGTDLGEGWAGGMRQDRSRARAASTALRTWASSVRWGSCQVAPGTEQRMWTSRTPLASTTAAPYPD